MKDLFVARHFILLLAGFFAITQIVAQPSDPINILVENLLKKDLRSISISPQDSILVNESLKNSSRCIELRNDSAVFYAGQAAIMAEKSGLIAKISPAMEELGKYYMTKENFSEAINCYIQALKLEEKLGNQLRIADFFDLLGVVYYYQEIFSKALEYNEKALCIYQNLKDTLKIAKALSHLGSLHLSREYCEKRTPDQIKSDQKTAMNFYRQALHIYEINHFEAGEVHIWLNIGNVYRRMGDAEKAVDYIQKALTYYRETSNQNGIAETLRTLALAYNRMEKYDLALKCLTEAIDIALLEKYTDGIQYLYESIAQTYDNLKDYKNARDYYVKYMIIRDSVYNNEKSNQIFELETKYQAEKKQKEIERLTLVKRQRTLAIYILIATFLMVSLLGWNYFRNIRNKKIIADQKLEIKEKQLLELEKERQLTAAKSVLQGEEAERSRLAGDLHDGLGGLLAGVKLKLSSMKENAIITSENLAHFNHALDLLDTSITEMRRVAHNLMPETLMHYGLRTALGDFIKQVAPEGEPQLRFSTFGSDLRFGKELEITVYRISQELVTNALKHAHANQIDLQLFTENERICVQVNDNGIGFNPNKLDDSKAGKGLKNIHDRATAFNGRFEILSEPAKGTESTLEFLIS